MENEEFKDKLIQQAFNSYLLLGIKVPFYEFLIQLGLAKAKSKKEMEKENIKQFEHSLKNAQRIIAKDKRRNK